MYKRFLDRQQARSRWVSARKWLPHILLLKEAVFHVKNASNRNQEEHNGTVLNGHDASPSNSPRSDTGNEKANEWSSAFKRLIMDPRGRQLFTEFLESEYSDENILFYAACEELQYAKTERQLRRLANEIFNTFIAVDSPLEINIDRETRNEITLAMKRADIQRDVFRPAENIIYQLMEKDCFGRFARTKVYEKFASS